MSVSVGQYTYGVLHMPRWEVSIPIAREGKIAYLPIRLTCKAIGVDPQTQFTVIHGRFEDTSRTVPFNIEGVGWRPFLALPSDDAALWIAGINPKKCKITARGTLEDFIAEAKQVLEGMIFKPDYVPSDPSSFGVLSLSTRTVQVFACECGRHWRIVTEDGETSVERISGDEG
jgi:hypothetical protein